MTDLDTIPYGYCQCGCGEKTRLAPQRNKAQGWRKGEPVKYRSGHNRNKTEARTNRLRQAIKNYRLQWENQRPDIPYGFCWCGCGEQTNAATVSSSEKGYVKGEPRRYKLGHRVNDDIPEHDYVEQSRGYKTPCWVWQRSISSTGYGVFGGSPKKQAHSEYYETVYGIVPPPLELDHLCRVRCCVNPEHLEAVTHAENMRRGKNTKLTRTDVEEIKRLHSSGDYSQRSLGERFGVSESAVHLIIKGKNWTAP